MTGPRVTQVVGTISGGTAGHVAMLAAGCRAQGLTVSVIGPAAARPWFSGTGAEFTVAEIGDRPHPARDVAAIVRLRRLLRRAAPDVAHAHGMRAGAFAALALAGTRQRRPGLRGAGRSQAGRAAAGRAGPALLVTVHNAAPDARLAAAVYRILERIVARRADAVLCASGDLAARMRQLGARDTAQAVVAAPQAGPPPEAAVSAARSDLGAGPRPVLLTAGRLAAQKGLDVLLAAAASWRNRDPAPVLAIAGAGPLAADLAGRAEASGLDVRFLGHREDVPALLAAADVVVVPSRWEARALIVQEALLAGKPVVASRVGGIPDITGDDGAILVPPGDPAALAAAVLSLLDDPALASRLSAAARRRAAALPSEADAVAAAVAMYHRLASEAARPASKSA
ncbi:MAG TPA: glycosyltransferase family 4 protein [Streptosporangiaceae bacterium]|jgi:glycosyltransferase involved in cell wall biosynthesis